MLCNNLEARNLARLLISGYPNSLASEPEYYLSQIVAVFVQFDLDLVKKAISPDGIPAVMPKYLPTIGEINKWLNEKEKDYSNITRRIPSVVEQIGDWVDRKPTSRLKEMGKAWLDRTDPIAQQLSGQKPKGHVAEEAKKRIISQIGKEAFDALPNQPFDALPNQP